MEQRYIGVKDLAQYWGIKKNTVYDWVYRKKITYYKVNGCVRFDLREIEKMMEENRVEKRD